MKRFLRKRTIILSIVSTLLIGVTAFLYFHYTGGQKESQQYSNQRTSAVISVGQQIEQYRELYGNYPCAYVTTPCDWQEELAKVNPHEPVPNDPETHEPYVYLTDGEKSLVGAKMQVPWQPWHLCRKSGDRGAVWLVYQTAYKDTTFLCAHLLDETELLRREP